jgi:DNA helicase-2/ATP-dependent DNA helicase PcrA
MVDEFQDIDRPQYVLMEKLRGYHNNLFIVGDPDQTIYSWRGANGRYLTDFEKDHDDVKTIMMMKNYRSTPEILAAANSLIDKNKTRIKKDLIASLGSGKKVVCHRGLNQEAEAKWIAEKIKDMIAGGIRPGDITILYRAHYVTRSVEEELLKEKIPYTIYSGVQFFGRAEIKDALCYLRMIAYKDDLSFLRICNKPKRNIGKRRISFLQEYADSHDMSLYESLKMNLEEPLFRGTKAASFVSLIDEYAESSAGRQISDLLSSVLNDSGYEKMLRTEGSQERLDNLAELKQSIYDYETTCGEETDLGHYLSHVALFSNADTAEHSEKIKLMTVHAAKGLEFPYVFLCGMCEGIFPSRKVLTLDAMEEERRLAFVAITRAEKELYLTMSGGRNLDGSPRYPSRFVLDIDQDLIEYTEKPDEGLIREASEYIRRKNSFLAPESSLETFVPGTRVEHKIFGTGEIVDVDMQKKAHIVMFDDMDTPRAISFRAKLIKI